MHQAIIVANNAVFSNLYVCMCCHLGHCEGRVIFEAETGSSVHARCHSSGVRALYSHVCVCVCACVRACVRACVHACVCVYVCMCVCTSGIVCTVWCV